MMRYFIAALLPLLTVSCAGKKNVESVENSDKVAKVSAVFNADSAYSYVQKQVDFGPRVHNTDGHRLTGEWLAGELKRRGATVHLQETTIRSADGVDLPVKNIMGQFNPGSTDRLLLLAHWDTRPWADEDPVESNRKKAIDGANDGASGVGVLLEIARQMALKTPERGVDILFVDAEDRGETDNEESWALGAAYFAENPVYEGYRPTEAILLDMVGARDARFPYEQISQVNAPDLLSRVWAAAADAGYGDRFPCQPGGGVTDDHLPLLKAGIPAIDIIDFRPDTGFSPGWHTLDDNMSLIDRESLRAVGQTLLQFIYGKY